MNYLLPQFGAALFKKTANNGKGLSSVNGGWSIEAGKNVL
jgi:hypothetical protein